MISNGKMMKPKVVVLDDIYKFLIETFLFEFI